MSDEQNQNNPAASAANELPREGGGQIEPEVAPSNLASETVERVQNSAAHDGLEKQKANGAGAIPYIPPFNFENPFAANSAPENQKKLLSPHSSGLSTASVKDSRVGGEQSAVKPVENKRFSELSASSLAKLIGDKISTFKSDVWISEDVSGAAFLEVVTPSSLPAFLEQTILIASYFMRLRVEKFLKQLIREDENLPANLQQLWAEPMTIAKECEVATPSKPEHTVMNPSSLNFTPPNHHSSSFNNHSDSVPSFMSEIKGRAQFSLANPQLFSVPPPCQPGHADPQCFFTGTSNPQFSVGGASAVVQQSAGPTPFAITIIQPSAEKPKYLFLEHIDNEEHVLTWLKKNRKETLLAAKQDRRPLTELMTHDCKQEIARMIYAANTDDVDIFNAEAPYPRRGWEDVTEKLLLRCLFRINGPRSASDAKEKLKKKMCHFNDATTEQKHFISKFRKHCTDFVTCLHDFEHCVRLWPKEDNDLSHLKIIEAFDYGFSSQETTKGPDNTTNVPKCSNFATIREKIRENKKKSLEEIIELLIKYYERHDDIIRANRTEYLVKPWRATTEKGKKRQFNQIASGGQAGQAQEKKSKPPAPFPRCNNCGSKGHACGEETCYLFGHPKGKGANGNWPEGTPSLNLNPTEWKDWRVQRHAIFYAYPCNANKARPSNKGA